MPTSFPMANPWLDGEGLNAAKMLARTTTPSNDLAASVAALGQGFLGSSSTGSNVTFSNTSAWASTVSFTFTLATQRRVRIDVGANFAMLTGTNGRYSIQAGYNSGASPVIGSFIAADGPARPVVITVIGSTMSVGQEAEGTVLLAAGQYTAYASMTRTVGGGTTDIAGSMYVAVYDVGAV